MSVALSPVNAPFATFAARTAELAHFALCVCAVVGVGWMLAPFRAGDNVAAGLMNSPAAALAWLLTALIAVPALCISYLMTHAYSALLPRGIPVIGQQLLFAASLMMAAASRALSSVAATAIRWSRSLKAGVSWLMCTVIATYWLSILVACYSLLMVFRTLQRVRRSHVLWFVAGAGLAFGHRVGNSRLTAVAVHAASSHPVCLGTVFTAIGFLLLVLSRRLVLSRLPTEDALRVMPRS